jgi:hypothetical protein
MLRTTLGRLLTVTALVATNACGDGGGAKPAPQDPFDDGTDMDAGKPLDAGRRDAAADAGPVLGPLIEVLSPVETDDPASADIVVGSTLTVRCSVKRNPKGELVDTKSVKVTIYAGDETKAAISQVATSTSEAEVFQAENINLVNVPHGVIRVECTASDVATKVQTSSVGAYTLYDQGPKISFLDPMDKGYVSVGKGDKGTDVVIRFKVEPQPLGDDDDDGAAIGEIKASVAGKVIPAIEPSTTEEDVYTFPIDFSDTQFFSAIPKTLSVRIDATNSRKPKPRTATANLAVGVDSEGPVITVKSPARVANQDPVVSGKVDILLEVKDTLAGVNATSVQIQIQKNAEGPGTPGNDFYQAQPLGDGTYSVSFETGTYSGRPRITITLLAKDNVGIATESSLTVDVDTVPPWISLDAPTVREFKLGTPNLCSGAFDPLGDAVNEGVVVGDAYRVRALIWDRPLTASMQTSSRYAMIDNASVRLYIQHNVSVPLLIDSDGDPNHECDKINVNVANSAQAPTAIVLSPVKTAGTAVPAGYWVGADPSYTFQEDMSGEPSVEDPNVPSSYICHSITASFGNPKPISPDTTMTRVIKHVVPGNYEVVYADSPTASGTRSTGVDYYPPPGWACLVAAAKDNAGNAAFSPPMRVCAQRMGVTCESTPPPSITCTDGCVIPSKFARDAPNAMPRVLQYSEN